MLEELSKNHQEWLKMALSICKNTTDAQDLVQDMYIKIHRIKPKKINKWYVYRTLSSIYIDNIRKRKETISIEQLFNLEDKQTDKDILEFRKMITTALEELQLFDCEILLHTHEKSLRKTEDELGIQFTKLHYWKKNALQKLHNTRTIQELKKYFR